MEIFARTWQQRVQLRDGQGGQILQAQVHIWPKLSGKRCPHDTRPSRHRSGQTLCAISLFVKPAADGGRQYDAALRGLEGRDNPRPRDGGGPDHFGLPHQDR